MPDPDLTPQDLHVLREKIASGKGTLEEAMLSIRAIRLKWTALPEEKSSGKKAEPKPPKEPQASFSEDF